MLISDCKFKSFEDHLLITDKNCKVFSRGLFNKAWNFICSSLKRVIFFLLSFFFMTPVSEEEILSVCPDDSMAQEINGMCKFVLLFCHS